MSLFDNDEPPPPPTPSRGKLTKPERQQSNRDLAEVVQDGTEEEKQRAMAAAIYRLGGVPLDDLARQMMKLLEGHV